MKFMLGSFKNTIISSVIIAIVATVTLEVVGYPLREIFRPTVEQSGEIIDQMLVDLGDGNHQAVLDAIAELETRKGEFPTDLLYVKGLSQLKSGEPQKAIETFDLYLDRAGKDGAHYAQVLSLRAQAEVSIKSVSDDRTADLLTSRLAEELKQKRYKDGLKTISEIEALDRPFPTTLLFYKGYLMILNGDYTPGRKVLESYLSSAGPDAKHRARAETILKETLIFDKIGQQRIAEAKRQEEQRLKAEAAERARVAEVKRKAEAETKRKAEQARLAEIREQERISLENQKLLDEAQRQAEQIEKQRIAQERRDSPGLVFKDCRDCPDMVVVPAGEFLMGSPRSERGRENIEGPQSLVKFARSFAVARFEITRSQFSAFVAETGHKVTSGCTIQLAPTFSDPERWAWDKSKNWRNPGYAQGSNEPVVCITQSSARAFTKWLSKETGQKYRLLKESEWEYVARGGSQTRFFYGDNPQQLCMYANVSDNTWNQTIGMWLWSIKCNDGYYRTSPVGKYPPNDFGVYDVIGNVMEVVDGCYVEYGPQKRSNCNLFVVRGGSYASWWEDDRSAHRGLRKGVRRADIGFRIARKL